MLGPPSGFDLATTRESELRRVALLAAALAVALPGAAFAVWGGQQDTAHPGVGAMYFDFSGNGAIEADELVCSGSYAGRSKNGAQRRLPDRGPLPAARRRRDPGQARSSSRSTGTDATASPG